MKNKTNTKLFNKLMSKDTTLWANTVSKMITEGKSIFDVDVISISKKPWVVNINEMDISKITRFLKHTNKNNKCNFIIESNTNGVTTAKCKFNYANSLMESDDDDLEDDDLEDDDINLGSEEDDDVDLLIDSPDAPDSDMDELEYDDEVDSPDDMDTSYEGGVDKFDDYTQDDDDSYGDDYMSDEPGDDMSVDVVDYPEIADDDFDIDPFDNFDDFNAKKDLDGIADDSDRMAYSQIASVIDLAEDLKNQLDDGVELPAWMKEKLIVVETYLSDVIKRMKY